ncbi:TonB-dependent receptor [Pseudoalteromonas sp. G4]|uniref:TonB-dependent receptor n=1 Tax=Pseudoalteromonas sp. G4 TaxID=2992761 RepID=UPI00237DF5BC|nr:TonB-dependent receptor [Pseudoalteromonas sp. G4]MDE3270779.1 TonB-dependent receptor [Pseudoalteromonas sp. G4]
MNNSQKQFLISSLSKSIIMALSALPLCSYANSQSDTQKDVEIIEVTAQKRSQSILQVHLAVDSISSDVIEKTNSLKLSDIDDFVPGFSFSDGNVTQAGVTMRGVSSPNISVGGDPSAASFFDDVYMPRAAQNVIFSDVQRVEVLKGPQGTLFGRNAATGVVNIIPNSPDAEKNGFVKANLGNLKLKRFEGMANFAVTDNLFVRVNGLSNQRDGNIENQFISGFDGNDENHKAARIAVKYVVNTDTSIQLAYDWDKVKQAPPEAIGISEYTKYPDPFAGKFENDVFNGEESRDMDALTLKVESQLTDDWSVKLVSSNRQWQTINREDEDGLALATRHFDTSNNEDSDIFYNELQFNYQHGNISYVGGITYSEETVSQVTELNLNADTVMTMVTNELGNMFGVPLNHLWDAAEFTAVLNYLHAVPGVGQALDPIYMMLGVETLTPEVLAYAEQMQPGTIDMIYDSIAYSPIVNNPAFMGPSYQGKVWQEMMVNTGDFKNYGIYSDIDYRINEQFSVIAGLRYSKDKKAFSWQVPVTSFSDERSGVENLIFPSFDKISANDSWSKTTGRLIGQYRVNNKNMTYLSYSTGYKSGGYDSLDPTTAVNPFKPELTTNYEFGYKGEAFAVLRSQIAVYQMEIDDRQTTVESKPPGQLTAFPVVINGDQIIKGIEINLNWQVTDSFTASLVTEFRETESDWDDYFDASSQWITGKSKGNTNLAYTTSFNYLPDFPYGNLAIRLDYIYAENDRDSDPGYQQWYSNIPHYLNDRQDLNLNVTWQHPNDAVQIALWGKNLLDEKYISGIRNITTEILNTPFVSIEDGITYGVEFKYTF